MKYSSNSEKQTLEQGVKLAKKLNGGEVLALSGDLGAGKTIFTKGLALGLEIKEIITSPTFVLMKVYEVKKPNQKGRIRTFVHLDCYRVNHSYSIADIGILDYLFRPDTVVVVEWAERIKDLFSQKPIEVKIEIISGDKRTIEIKK